MKPSRAAAFVYQHSYLSCGSISLLEVAREFGTPTYVYSLDELRARANSFLTATAPLGEQCLTCYAVKANGNPALLRFLSVLGLGADIVSGGEFFLAQAAGFRPQETVFSGVGKTAREIEEAIVSDILALHVESQDELSQVAQIAQNLGRVAPVAVRVNPDIPAGTHAHVSTGEKTHKFGVAVELAQRMVQTAAEDSWLQPVGISTHIGSQITSLAPFRQAATVMVQLADNLAMGGVRLDYIDMGGGLGIDYGAGSGPRIADWIGAVSEPIIGRGYRLLVEPGRSIIGPAGVLVTQVLLAKEPGGKHIIVVDSGMNDLLRPALYDAHHPVLPLVRSDSEQGMATMDIVGPVCESTDVLAKGRLLPRLRSGDYLAFMQAGAYGYSMSSNYNGRQRPAEVLIDGDRVRCIRERESYDSLLIGCAME